MLKVYIHTLIHMAKALQITSTSLLQALLVSLQGFEGDSCYGPAERTSGWKQSKELGLQAVVEWQRMAEFIGCLDKLQTHYVIMPRAEVATACYHKTHEHI